MRPCPPHRRYFHPSRSSTFEKTPNVPWSLEYSDQSNVFGDLHTDVVQVAGFVIDRQVIGVGKSLFGFKDNGIDGSMGLGLPELSATGGPAPTDNLIEQAGMKPEVGIWLGSENQGGELVFGGKDSSRYDGELTYYDVPAGSVYWSVPVHSLIVVPPSPPPPPPKPAAPLQAPGKTVTTAMTTTTTTAPPPPPVPTSAGTLPPPAPPLQVNGRIGSGTKLDMPNIIFDTSSNLILLPPRVAAATHRYIHNWFFGLYSGYSFFSGSYTIPCTLKTDIYFDIGPRTPNTPATAAHHTSSTHSNDSSTTTGNSTTTDNPLIPSQYKFKVAGKDLVRERVPVIGGIFNLCFSGIQASKNDEDDWVFGNIWFLGNYMTLNHRDRKMGIAPTIRPEQDV
ncbi:hypothetical protein BG003_002270 [Podila horticola]|nr:hypothetical protein BG003_002270 [Podila horticola]